jgi:hypothetical protein
MRHRIYVLVAGRDPRALEGAGRGVARLRGGRLRGAALRRTGGESEVLGPAA